MWTSLCHYTFEPTVDQLFLLFVIDLVWLIIVRDTILFLNSAKPKQSSKDYFDSYENFSDKIKEQFRLKIEFSQ